MVDERVDAPIIPRRDPARQYTGVMSQYVRPMAGRPTFPKVFPTEAPPVQVETAPKNNLAEKKPLPNLIPMDILMKYLEPAYQEGILKYSRESWRGGFKTSVCIDSARRHIYAFYYGGQDMDPDSLVDNKHHLAAAIFWLTCNLQSMDARPELDDRWSKND